MNVLEKISEELENESQLAHEEMRRCARGNPLQFDEAKGYARAMEYVVDAIRSRMDEREVFKFDFNRVKSFDCQCGRHYVNTYDGGWIPVDERLPEEGEKILYDMQLVTLEDGEVCLGVYRNQENEWWTRRQQGEEWYTNKHDVVAWQPLPEPIYQESKIDTPFAL